MHAPGRRETSTYFACTPLAVPIGTAGLLTSAYAVGMIVGAPAMAAIARRWPARTALLGCLIIFLICHVVGALTSIFAILATTRAVAALANAGFLAVALSTATRIVAADRKGRALAVLLTGTTVATVAGVPAGALLGTAMGWRATFWAIAMLCVLAALGIMTGVPRETRERTPGPFTGSSLRTEVAQLREPRLLRLMVMGALINGATFAGFTFLAPIVTDTAELDALWVPPALMLFGLGTFLGVTVAGRVSDQRPGVIVGAGGPLLLLGWIAMALSAADPVALLTLVFIQGLLAFAVGSTVITRVLYAAAAAPTLGGSYATAALNIGAAAGPALAAAVLSATVSNVAPVWVAVALTGFGLVMAWPLSRTIARPPHDQIPTSTGDHDHDHW